MKLVKYYIAAVTLLLLMVISSAAKQPPPDLGYEPPAGWEFVMKLDSASSVFLYCHNDTCFMYTEFSSGRPYIYDITIDGGETWNKIPVLPMAHIVFMPNTMTLHYVDLEGSNFNYQKSTDFFKTSEKYFICKSPYPDDTLYQSPIDPNILIATFKYEEFINETYDICDMFAMLSRDGGKTWEKMTNLYRHPENLTIYKFNFDWAEKGHWFVSAEDGKDTYGILKKVSPPVYLETFDDGKTFREIKFNPANKSGSYTLQFGLDGKRTFRKCINKYASGIRVYKYEDTITQSDFYDWLYIMDPTKPKTNIDSGYRRGFLFIDGFYQYDFSNFNNIFIPVFENKGNIKNNDYIFEYCFYTSNDNGNNWFLMNNLNQTPYYYGSFLDQGTKTLWIYVKDEAWKKGTKMYKGSLWKLKLPWETTSVENIEDKKGINISPNPAGDFITINLQPSEGLKPSEGSVVEIFDMLGVKVISELIHPLTSSHRMNIENLPAGVYFIKIGEKVEKFVKM